VRAGGVPAVKGERVAARWVVGRLLAGEWIIRHVDAGSRALRQLVRVEGIGDLGRFACRSGAVLRNPLVVFHRRSFLKKVGR
jgi:hypothetical protein